MQVAVTHSLGGSSDRLRELLTAPHDAGCTLVPLLYCTLMSQQLHTPSQGACLCHHPFLDSILVTHLSHKSNCLTTRKNGEDTKYCRQACKAYSLHCKAKTPLKVQLRQQA